MGEREKDYSIELARKDGGKVVYMTGSRVHYFQVMRRWVVGCRLRGRRDRSRAALPERV